LWFYDSNSTTSSSTTPRRPRRTQKKLSFPLPRINYYLLSPQPTLGGSAMKNYLAYHWLWKIAKALVAGVPCRILVNLVYSRMKLD
jgi:hypothetical protein